jgi:hypothetical protein
VEHHRLHCEGCPDPHSHVLRLRGLEARRKGREFRIGARG